MKSIENTSDFNALLNQPKPILLDFYADWCGPCQTLLTTVDKLSKEFEGSVEVRKVNVDQNRELAAQFNVRSIPALFFIKDDVIVDKISGLTQEEVVRTKLNDLLN